MADSPHAILTDSNYALGANQVVYFLGAATYTAKTSLNLTGNAGWQTIEGNDGDNILDGKGGEDTLIGRFGNDTYHYYNQYERFVENGGYNFSTGEIYNEGNDIVVAHVDCELNFRSIETLQAAAGTAPLKLRGGLETDFVIGNDGSNTLIGFEKSYRDMFDDYIYYGTTTLMGGLGDDTYETAFGVAVTEKPGEGIDTVMSEYGATLEANVENLVLKGGGQLGVGNELANTITGNAFGNTIDGKAGADTMIGGLGDDTFYTDNAGDRVVEDANGGSDTVLATNSFFLEDGQSVELLKSASATATTALNLYGNELVQTLRGNAGDNRLDGEGGADTLIGYGGNDVYGVDNAADRIYESANAGNDRVVAGISYTLAAGLSIEVLSTVNSAGRGIINLTGNEQNQTIFGNVSANRLDGKAGADTLYGYGGEDVFLFTTTANAGDRIKDFVPADDTIQLSKAIFAALPSGRLAQTAFKDVAAPGATIDKDDRILYNHGTGVLSYDTDGIGTAKAVAFAILDNHAILTYQDFLIV